VIVLYNPRAITVGQPRLPKSVLALGRMFAPDEYEIVDANRGSRPVSTILEHFRRRPEQPRIVGLTTMQGPQLRNAILDCQKLRRADPSIVLVWGGYSPSQHAQVCLESPLVDFVIRGQGELSFVELVQTLRRGGNLAAIQGLSWRRGTEIVHNPDRRIVGLNQFPFYPYEKVGLCEYVMPSYLGSRTLSHFSSLGCPYNCDFCAITEVFRRRWYAEEPERTLAVIERFRKEAQINALEFFDGDFFVHEDRVRSIAQGLIGKGITWWGESRVDHLLDYQESTLRLVKQSGCPMIYLGADSGDDAILSLAEKEQTTQQIVECGRRLTSFGITPEFSFIVGYPFDPEQEIERTLQFIRRLKAENPNYEILIFRYTPVPRPGAVYNDSVKQGFEYPKRLEQWADQKWVLFSTMRVPHTPWFSRRLERKVRNFELALLSKFPTVTDIRQTPRVRRWLRRLGAWRYDHQFYNFPFELKLAHKWIHYRQVEAEGF
jgi:pyruvate-formate lyase-activating enzyme